MNFFLFSWGLTGCSSANKVCSKLIRTSTWCSLLWYGFLLGFYRLLWRNLSRILRCVVLSKGLVGQNKFITSLRCACLLIYSDAHLLDCLRILVFDMLNSITEACLRAHLTINCVRSVDSRSLFFARFTEKILVLVLCLNSVGREHRLLFSLSQLVCKILLLLYFRLF